MNYSIRHALLLVVGPMVMVGCGTDSATGPPADYTLSLTPGTLTITQGASGTMNVGIVRSNFTGAITLRLSGSRQNLLPVAGSLAFTTVSTGNDVYSCGVTTTGSAYCWGLNAYGQSGDGTTANKLVPTLVSGGLTFVSVAASTTPDGAHTCGLTTSGAVYCWGLNDHGQLGDGTTTQHLLPTLVKFP